MDKKLSNLLTNAYAPYSKVHVAAILKTKDGREFMGVNVENSAYPSGICAERSAIFAAATAGVKPGEIDSIELTSSLEQKLYPCGACRQVMAEFFEPSTIVRVWNKEGKHEVEFKDLVPFTVTKGSFGWK